MATIVLTVGSTALAVVETFQPNQTHRAFQVYESKSDGLESRAVHIVIEEYRLTLTLTSSYSIKLTTAPPPKFD